MLENLLKFHTNESKNRENLGIIEDNPGIVPRVNARAPFGIYYDVSNIYRHYCSPLLPCFKLNNCTRISDFDICYYNFIFKLLNTHRL